MGSAAESAARRGTGRPLVGAGRPPAAADTPVADLAGGVGGAPFGADPARSVRASITQASVERAFSILLAMTAVGLGIVDTPAVLAQLPYLDPFWGPVVALALGASFVLVGVSAFVQRVAQLAQITCALLFLVALVTWPLTVQEPIPSTQQPWPWWFCTVGSTAAAMGFATWRATVYTALVPAIYVVLRLTPIGGDAGIVRALLDGVYTGLLSGAVLVIAVVLRRAASSVDSAQSTAVRRYSLAIREHAVEVERVQVDAIVHDSVLTTLLSAARADTLEGKTLSARMARNAIDHLEAAATDGPDDDTLVSLAELRTRIGEAVGALAVPVRLVPAPAGQVQQAASAGQVQVPASAGQVQLPASAGQVQLPAPVADALASAAIQAAVNSVQHAGGAEVARWVRVEQIADGVHIEVGDEGRGFDLATIPPERLGVRRSIRERVAAVEGRAEVHTAPGRGTRIELWWSPTGASSTGASSTGPAPTGPAPTGASPTGPAPTGASA